MDNLHPTDIVALDEKLFRIQKSTRTLMPCFLPIHNTLRTKSKFYYNWHLTSYYNKIHYSALVLAVASVIALYLHTAATPTVEAAASTCYWVGGTATWDASNVNSWASSSGGTAGTCDGGVVPGADDTVIFDSNSGTSATVTLGEAYSPTVLGITLNKSDLTLALGANTLTISADSSTTFTFTAGTVTGDNTGDDLVVSGGTGNTADFNGGTFGANVKVTTGNITLDGATFNGTTNLFKKTWTAANNCAGGNTFGSDSTTTFYFNAGSSTNGWTLAASAGNSYNGNIVVESNGGYLYVGDNSSSMTTTSTLATGKTMAVGSNGFTAGRLYFYGFTQSGSTSQTITLTGTAEIYFFNSTTFNGSLAVSSPVVALASATFNGATNSFTKTGTGIYLMTGGDTFGAGTSTTFTQNSTGVWTFASTTADTYAGDVTFVNNSTGTINVVRTGVNDFGGNLTLTPGSGTIAVGGNGGTAQFSSTGTQTLTSGGVTIPKLTHTGSGTLQLESALTATTFTNSAGIFYLNGQNLTVSTYSNTATLQLNGDESTVSLTNDSDSGLTKFVKTTGTITVKSLTPYYNIEFDSNASGDGDAIFTLPANTTINGNLTVTDGSLDLAGKNLTLAASSVVSNLDTIKMQGGETFSNVDDLDLDSGTVVYYGASGGPFTPKDFGSTDYFNLTIAAAGAYTFQPSGTLTVAGAFSLSAGTVDNATNNPNLVFKGNVAFSGTPTWTKGTGTITVSGTVAQTLDFLDNDVESLGISNTTATVSLATNGVTTTGLTVSSGANFDLAGQDFGFTAATNASNSGTITLIGNETLTNVNNLDVDTGIVVYKGRNISETLIINNFGATDYFNLTINDANGTKATYATANSQTLTVAGDFTITSAAGVTLGSAGALAVTSSLNIQASGGIFNNATNDNAVTVGGDVTMANSQVDMGDATWTVSGHFNSYYVTTFNKDTSSLVMDGADKNLICNGISPTGGNGLYNLTIPSGAVINIPSDGGTVYTFGILDVDGTITVTDDKWLVEAGVATADLQISATGHITGNGFVAISNSCKVTEKLGVIDTAVTYIRGNHDPVNYPIVPSTWESAAVNIYNASYAGSSFDTTLALSNGTYTFNGNVSFMGSSSVAVTHTIDNSANPNFVFKGNVTFTNGTFGTLTWTKGTGGITLAGTGNQSINFLNKTIEDIDVTNVGGIVTFATNGFTADALAASPDASLKFEASKTFAFGAINLDGTSGHMITMVSTSPTNYWLFNVSEATPSVSYVSATDSDASGGSEIDASGGTNYDGGHNLNWDFGVLPPSDPASLAQLKTDNTAISIGDWTGETSVKYTATVTDGLGAQVAICIEKDPIDTAFSDTEDGCGSLVDSGSTANYVITSQTDQTQYHWQVRAKNASGLYSNWVTFGANNDPSDVDYGIDNITPYNGTVYDGSEAGVDYDYNNGSLAILSANWSGMSWGVSGLSGYEYAIGTTVGGSDVKDWTGTSTTTSFTSSDLFLHTGQTYYVSVRTTSGAGLVSTPVTSDGIAVAPTLTFALVGGSTITFDSLGAANSYTDSTKTTTIDTSTNAYEGYAVYAQAIDKLRVSSQPTSFIDHYASPNSSPTSWSGVGFGYTTNDSDLSGGTANRFTDGGPKYAGWVEDGPGDPVADHTATVSGTPVANEQFTIGYRVTADAITAAGSYQTMVIYTCVPKY